MRNGTWPVSRPDINVRWLRATSKAISEPEFPAPAMMRTLSLFQLTGIPVIFGMKLHDFRIEQLSEPGLPGSWIRGHRHHNVIRFDSFG